VNINYTGQEYNRYTDPHLSKYISRQRLAEKRKNGVINYVYNPSIVLVEKA